MKTLAGSAKAIVGFLVPLLTQLAADLQRGLKWSEMARNLIVSFITAIVVWVTPNRVPPEEES